MKILIVNYRYFVSGGPERYMFNLTELLESKGHEVIPFSVKHKNNRHSKYSDYFLSPVGDGSEIQANDYNGKKIKLFIRILARYFYSLEAKTKITLLINIVKPDVLYILNYKSLISPSIIDAAHKLKIPIVHRLSDFGKICSNNVLYDYTRNTICEKCINGSRINGILNKCVNKSYLNSILRVFANYVEDLIKVNEKVSAFVITSPFSLEKFKQAKLPQNKLCYVPTFYPQNKITRSEVEDHHYALYFGRVDYDKGIHIAVDAFNNSKFSLYIIGGSTDLIYRKKLIETINNSNIKLFDEMDFTSLQKYIKNCSFVIVPSLWYDNMPNSILEAYGNKKPVVASNEGSLKCLVEHEKTGLLFERGNANDLKEKVKYLFQNPLLSKRLGENALKKLEIEYNEENHINKLMEVFHKVLVK